MKGSKYFQRYAYPTRFIQRPIQQETLISIVIPAFKESNIGPSIQSIYNCMAPSGRVELIIVINHGEQATIAEKEANFQCKQTVESLLTTAPEWIDTHIIEAYDLPKKKAGVGLARKIGMDEAAFRFNSINTNGLILCFDADSSCEDNYLKAVQKAFNDQQAKAASIHYEHPLFKEDGQIDHSIINYELHLRYYIQALAYCKFPYAFHTIGSSMAVDAITYQQSGGMNTRKAGEDFYFLHKLMPLGNFISVTNTKIIPSARESDRVPFGTGKAIMNNIEGKKLLGLSYNFSIFKLIRSFFQQLILHKNIENVDPPIKAFFAQEKLNEEFNNVLMNTTNSSHFKERFFMWFNGFKVLKLVHFLKEKYYPDTDLENSVEALFQNDTRFKEKKLPQKDSFNQLVFLRKFEKELY